MTGPADDPSDRVTRMADYGAGGPRPTGFYDEHYDEQHDFSVDPDSAPDPWYRNRVLLALWAALAALLIVLIGYGLVHLWRGSESGGPPTTSTSTTPTRSSTSSPTTTTTPPSTSTTPPPETSEQAPPSGGYSPAPAEPPHHRHHFHLPHLPHGLF